MGGHSTYGHHPASSGGYRESDFGRGPGYGRSSWNPEPQFGREGGNYDEGGRQPAEGSRQGYRYSGEGNFRAAPGGMESERWDRSGIEWSGGTSGYGRGGSMSTGKSAMRTRRGPKGYKRSDERIREDVCDRLSDSDLNCEDVEVNVKNGEVFLTGTTDSGDTRREIERVAEMVPGVQDVTNQVRTRRETASPADGRKSNQGGNHEGSSPRRETSKST